MIPATAPTRMKPAHKETRSSVYGRANHSTEVTARRWRGGCRFLARPPSGAPALVLNADYRPLSYYPLSLWPWQETIKAVFPGPSGRGVDLRSHHPFALVRDETAERRFAEVLCRPGPAARLHAVQSVPARFVRLPVLWMRRRPHVRPCHAALPRRPNDLGKYRHRLRAVQSGEGWPDAPRSRHAAATPSAPPDDVRTAGPGKAVSP